MDSDQEKSYSDLPEIESGNKSESEFYNVGSVKLMLMTIFTFGLYLIYWFYRNWNYIEINYKEKITPWARGLFFILFTHSLFDRFDARAAEQGKQTNFKARGMATLFVVLLVAARIIDRLSFRLDLPFYFDLLSFLFFFISLYPLYLAQKVIENINDYVRDPLTSKFYWYNIIGIVLGAVLWFFSLLGLVYSALQQIIVR